MGKCPNQIRLFLSSDTLSSTDETMFTACMCGVEDLNPHRSSLFNVQRVHGNNGPASIHSTRTYY
jgi:hypothetical protein